MKKKCQAVVISCMDYRFHAPLFDYLQQQGLRGQYDLVSLPGACLNHSAKHLADIVEMAVTLHRIEGSVYLCHHEDCGAYELDADLEEQMARQSEDMKEFARLVQDKFPHLTIQLCFFTLEDDEPIQIELGEDEGN